MRLLMHKRKGYLGGLRYQTRVLSKYLSLCTCNYPFCSTHKSLIHLVNFGQFKLSGDIEKNPGHSFYVECYKNDSCSIPSRKRCSIWGKCGTTMCCNEFARFNYSEITMITSVNMIQIMTVIFQSVIACKTSYVNVNRIARNGYGVRERFFQFEYSKSYTCNMHDDVRIEGYCYCMPLETLLALNYNSVILTVGIIGVDSHARDMYC